MKKFSLVMRTLVISLLIIMSALSHAEGTWVGKPAPTLSLLDQEGKPRRLSDFKGKWVVLYFYPKDHTPGCTEEAKQFRDKWAEFRKANIMVVGVSADSAASHKRFATDLKLPYPLLADTKLHLSREMKVSRGIGSVGFASRQTFLIDPDGTVVYHYPDVNPSSHATQALEDVKRLSQPAP